MTMHVMCDADAMRILATLGAGSFASGAINVIDVGAIRDHAGASWDRRRALVADYVTRTFARRARASDMICPLSDTAFLAIQPGATQAAAIATCGSVAQDTLMHFLGTQAAPPVRLGQMMGLVGGVPQIRVIDDDTVNGAMKHGRRSNSEGNRPGSGAPVWQHFGGRLERRARCVVPLSPELEVAFHLEPVWNVRRGVVAAFLISPAIFGRFEGGLTPLTQAGIDVRANTEIALRSIDFAVHVLGAGRDADRRFGIHIPVPVDAITPSHGRTELMRRLQCLSDADRSVTFFELVGCSSGAPQTRLLDMVGVLKPYGRAVIARVEGLDPPSRSWADSGLTGAAASLDGPLKMQDHALLKGLRNFAAGASDYKAVIAHGLKTRGLVLGAWAHGFTHLSGDAISDEMDSSLEVKWLSADRVFAAA
jgi:hypothetical protein